MIVDGGDCQHGLESTVLDPWRSPPTILRPGAITLQDLHKYCPDVVLFGSTSRTLPSDLGRPSDPSLQSHLGTHSGNQADAIASGSQKESAISALSPEDEEMLQHPTTPGMKYRHYSPTAPVHLVTKNLTGNREECFFRLLLELDSAIASYPESLHRTPEDASSHDASGLPAATSSRSSSDSTRGVILVLLASLPMKRLVEEALKERVSSSLVTVRQICTDDDAAEFGRRLFAELRDADTQGARLVIVEGVLEQGVGVAVMNRLRKASSRIV
jgi:L-threonylcarbamoyladenylate synthase